AGRLLADDTPATLRSSGLLLSAAAQRRDARPPVSAGRHRQADARSGAIGALAGNRAKKGSRLGQGAQGGFPLRLARSLRLRFLLGPLLLHAFPETQAQL